MKAEDALEIIQVLEQYLPVIEESIPLLYKVGNILKPVVADLTDSIVDSNCRMFHRYVEDGMSREEALALVISTTQNITKSFNKK